MTTAIEPVPEEMRIHPMPFWRRLWMSALICLMTLILGCPIASLLTHRRRPFMILPGVISGGLFAFLASFGKVTVIPVGSAPQKTLPWPMFIGLREPLSPTILAVATLMGGCRSCS